MSAFDKIATGETLDLQSSTVKIAGSDGKQYTFTVTELTPTEIARCIDEFGEVDFLAVIYRSVRDSDGRRMSKEQAGKLPGEVISVFIDAYNGLIEPKKKPKAKTAKKV